MNAILNYGSMLIITLLALILLINIKLLGKSFGDKRGGTLIVLCIILMSYISIIIYPVNNILKHNIVIKTLLPGEKGNRGNRGIPGGGAICNTCGDDLCLKKILFNITNTYNYWRSLNNLDLYPDNYVIKNEFLKDKIRKHCASKEFQKIIKKYGSNNKKDCPNTLDNCGIYDYMFKMWSIWTLIILKYKNGFFFLESEALTDKDFDGLIEPGDSFQLADIVKFNTLETNYKIDAVKGIYPFFRIRNMSNSTKFNAHVNELKLETEYQKKYSWDNMFTNSASSTDSDPQQIGLNVSKIKKIKSDDNKITFQADDYNSDFFKVKGTPNRGRLSPFDEIEKYKAWYWGRSERLIPKIVIKPGGEDKDISLKKKTCYNTEGKIKIKESNNFYELFSTKKITHNVTGDTIDPFKQYGSSSVLFLRAKTYTDPDEHHHFKIYKPLGDIIIDESEVSKNGENNCLPNTENHIGNISKKITNINTLLVSGDIASPIDFEAVFSTVKTIGINKFSEGFTIWKPVPPPGYISLGYIIDTRPYPDGEEPPKPSRNIVACVPTISFKEIQAAIVEIWSNNIIDRGISSTLDGDSSTININLYRNPKLNTFSDNNSSYYDINESSKCKTYEQVVKEKTDTGEPIFKMSAPPKRSSIKDKKYSILKLYE